MDGGQKAKRRGRCARHLGPSSSLLPLPSLLRSFLPLPEPEHLPHSQASAQRRRVARVAPSAASTRQRLVINDSAACRRKLNEASHLTCDGIGPSTAQPTLARAGIPARGLTPAQPKTTTTTSCSSTRPARYLITDVQPRQTRHHPSRISALGGHHCVDVRTTQPALMPQGSHPLERSASESKPPAPQNPT